MQRFLPSETNHIEEGGRVTVTCNATEVESIWRIFVSNICEYVDICGGNKYHFVQLMQKYNNGHLKQKKPDWTGWTKKVFEQKEVGRRTLALRV